jgi:hypothetical protein
VIAASGRLIASRTNRQREDQNRIEQCLSSHKITTTHRKKGKKKTKKNKKKQKKHGGSYLSSLSLSLCMLVGPFSLPSLSATNLLFGSTRVARRSPSAPRGFI